MSHDKFNRLTAQKETVPGLNGAASVGLKFPPPLAQYVAGLWPEYLKGDGVEERAGIQCN